MVSARRGWLPVKGVRWSVVGLLAAGCSPAPGTLSFLSCSWPWAVAAIVVVAVRVQGQGEVVVEVVEVVEFRSIVC